MYQHEVETPEDFATWLDHERSDAAWPDGVDRPGEVEVHPQGQVYVHLEGDSAATATVLLRLVEQCGLRYRVARDEVAVFNPRPTCAADGCYADALGTGKHPDRCGAHARQANEAYLRAGGQPRR